MLDREQNQFIRTSTSKQIIKIKITYDKTNMVLDLQSKKIF